MESSKLNTTAADMAECDGEKVVTMMDVLQEQQDFEEDANAVLGASDDKECTFSKGYINRQAIYACLTCCAEAKDDPLKRAGVCLACSLNCHENHELVELYTKRHFRCDCGNPKFNNHPCQFTPNKTDLNEDNSYNQNFSGLYCICHRPYPDPESTVEDEMIQCIICEDWLHASHLEATLPGNDQYTEMICKLCMDKNEFLHDYSHLAVNSDEVVDVMGNDSIVISVNGHVPEGTMDIDQPVTEKPEADNAEKDELTKEVQKPDLESIKLLENIDKLISEKEEETVLPNVNGNSEDNNPEREEAKCETPHENKNDNIIENKESHQSAEENKNSDEPNTSDNNSSMQNNINDGVMQQKDESINIPGDSNAESTEQTDIGTSETQKESLEIPVNSDPVPSEQNGIESSETPEESSEVSVDPHKEPCEQNETDMVNKKQPVENSTTPIDKEENVITVDEPNKAAGDSVEVNREDQSFDDITPENKDSSLKSNEENVDNANAITEGPTDGTELNNGEKPTEQNVDPVSTTSNDHSEAESKEIEKPTMIIENSIESSTTKGNMDIDESSQEESEQSSNVTSNVVKEDVPGPSLSNVVSHSVDTLNENKRKLSSEQIDDSSSKKPKIDEKSGCKRPCGVKKIFNGATFWPSNFRQKLCTCNVCISMYKDLSVLFLTDLEDTVSAYEMLGKAKINGAPASQYEKGLEALSSLDRIQQINALTEYNKMRDKLLDFLKSFKDRQEVVKEEDIKEFFAGMKPKREPDGVYFCR